jgi:chromosome segregation ATPase
MNRSLQIINCIGVLVLAGLCVFQWRVNRQLNLEINALEKTRFEHVAKLEDQENALKASTGDLESFRQYLTRANLALKETETRLTTAERNMAQVASERDQLKVSVTNWAAAVTARDGQLKKMDDQLRALADDRNGAVVKFNELAEKYNGVVKDLNDRTRQFNELAEKFKSAAKE